jgi:hypothetical protein
MATIKEEKENNTPTPSPSPSPSQTISTEKRINILQLAQWLTNSVPAGNFLLKPEDLRILYLIMLWENIKQHRYTGNYENMIELANDKDIYVSEKELLKIINIVYSKKFYPSFINLLHL